MSVLANLKKPPFSLDEAAITWVETQLALLSTQEKIQQLFIHLTIGDDPGPIEWSMARKPGGVHRFVVTS